MIHLKKKRPATPRVTGLLTSADHDGPIHQMVVDGRGRWWCCEWTRLHVAPSEAESDGPAQ